MRESGKDTCFDALVLLVGLLMLFVMLLCMVTMSDLYL